MEITRLAARLPAISLHRMSAPTAARNIQPTIIALAIRYPASAIVDTSNWYRKRPGHLPNSMVPGLPNSLYTALTPVSACSTDGTDSCIQLRADAVGYAVNQLFATANSTEKVPNQFRIGLYLFIQYLYAFFPLTSSINGSPTIPSTINYAAANLASQLDTNTNPGPGSGGTHFENAFSTMNGTITSIGDGSSWNSTLPYLFLVTRSTNKGIKWRRMVGQ